MGVKNAIQIDSFAVGVRLLVGQRIRAVDRVDYRTGTGCKRGANSGRQRGRNQHGHGSQVNDG